MAAIILLQIKKWRWGRLSQISRGKLSHGVCARARARASVCVCVQHRIVVYTIHHQKLCTCMFILKENVSVVSNIFDREKFSAERCAFFPYSNRYWQDIPFLSYDIPGTLQGYSAGYPIGRKCQYPWDVHSTSSDILWISCLYPIRDIQRIGLGAFLCE